MASLPVVRGAMAQGPRLARTLELNPAACTSSTRNRVMAKKAKKKKKAK
jgi:hypothetical protein